MNEKDKLIGFRRVSAIVSQERFMQTVDGDTYDRLIKSRLLLDTGVISSTGAERLLTLPPSEVEQLFRVPVETTSQTQVAVPTKDISKLDKSTVLRLNQLQEEGAIIYDGVVLPNGTTIDIYTSDEAVMSQIFPGLEIQAA